MSKITAGPLVKAALLASFPFLVEINGTEESLHEYLAIIVLLIAVQHLLKQKWWFGMMRFGFRNQSLKLKMTAVLLVSFCCTVISGILISRYALPAARIKAIQPVMLDLHHILGYTTFFLTFLQCRRPRQSSETFYPNALSAVIQSSVEYSHLFSGIRLFR